MKKKLNKIIFNENTRQISNASFLDLLRYARQVDYALFIGGLTLCIINGMIGPFQAVIFMTLTNTLIKAEANFKNDTFNLEAFADEMLTSVYLYAAIGVATFLLGILSMSCLFTLSERQTYEIRKRYLAALLRQEMAWHDKNEPGALTAKMFAGIEQIKNGMGDKIGVFLQATAHLIFGIIIGFYYSWQLTSMLVLIVPMLMLSLFGSSKIQKNMSHHEMEAYGAAGAIANEVIGGIRTVASFNAQYAEVARYKDRLKYARKMGIRKALVNGFFIGIYWFLIFFSMGLIFWYGTKLVAEGIIKRGTMFAVFWAIMGGTIRIAQALPQLDLIVASKLAAGDIFRIIDMEPEIDCMSPRGLCPINLQGRIEFSNLHFRYPTRPDVKVLNGISFKVNPGRTIALVGHSGSGKSTIISLLLRFYEAQEGTITVDGIPIRDLNIEWLRNNIGLVSQEPVMFATTVEGNLKLGKENVTEDEMIKACTVANAHDFIMKLPKGYKTLIGAGGVSLSGGQKQRIAIARALVRDPKILLLDEATSALDSESEVIVQNALDQACASRTTITIAHRLSTIRHADQIIVFNMGNIAESGTHEELMKLNGIYQQLVQAQGIEKGDDDFVVSDVLPSTIPLRRGKSNIVKLDDEDFDGKRLSKDMLRRSEYLRRSLTSCSAQTDYENEEIRDELRDEGAAEASILDIIKFSDKEMGIAAIGLIFTIMRGLSWPTFSIIYGRTFLALSSIDKEIMMEKAMLNALLYFALAVGVAFSVFASAALFGIVGERMSMRLRIAVFTNILRQDSTFFDNELHSVGRLTSHLATDAQNVKAATDHRLAEVIQGIVSLFAGMLVGFWFGWNMAVIAIVTCAVLIILCSAVSQYLKFRGQKDVKLAGEAATVASETIENIRTIQALSKQRQIYQSFCVLSKEPHKRAIIRGLWQSVNYALVISFIQFNFAVSYRFGLWLLQNSWSEPFVIFQVIEVLNFASISVLAAASFFPEYIRARLSAALMFHLKSRIPSIDNLSEAGIRQSIKGNIQLENVSFAYPLRRQQAVIKNLSFSTTFGQKVALVGPSGCGKSTIISLLERFYDINDGILSIDGRDIRSYNIRHLRSHIALVGQEPILFNITIRDNIAYGCDHASQDEIEAAAKLANIHSFINALPQGYDTIVGSKGSHLSGGQKQRIAIARAIIRKPKILLFDEATSALDSESEKAVQEALELARCGRTCLVIAHRLSTIQDADLIIVMTNGQIIERGNHYQLLARKGLYYRLVEKQKIS